MANSDGTAIAMIGTEMRRGMVDWADANLVKQLLSSLLYVIFQDFSSIPKTPNNVVLTGINDLLVGLIFHIYIIQHTTLSVKQAFGLYPHT